MKLLFLLLINSLSLAATFTEASHDLGITFNHTDGRTGQFHMTETAGSGVAWLDFNNDHLLDLLLINGIDNKHKLYKNNGKKFSDVSKLLPAIEKNRGMGVCSADINQDGWVDFLITSYGDDVFYLNQQGNGFKERIISNKHKWSTACAFADIDNDGDLDLYIARYALFSLNGNKSCQSGNAKGYCNPTAYKGANDSLYLNDGLGDFKEVTQSRGIYQGEKDRGFSVVISDFDGDGDNDIYVANDGSENRLYLNDGKGFFSDNGLLSGVAINQNGATEASMGVSIADINHDGKQDIIVSHFSMETNTIYQNFGNNMFADMTQAFALNQSSYMSMGWGIAFTDVNNDSFEDLVVANGHIHDFINKLDSRQLYQQHNQVFLNQKGQKFTLQPYKKSFTQTASKSSRGMAIGDFNNDGKPDLAINNIVDKADIFKNIDDNHNNWLGVKLIGSTINSSAIGAVVILKSGDIKQRKEVLSGGSFMSQSDLRLLFGLGKNSQPVELTIKWPNGKITHKTIEKLNRYHSIRFEQLKI